jgi:coenzyme F420 hydrogenase subunit beta
MPPSRAMPSEPRDASHTVSSAVENQLCAGCGLCASVSQGAITMEMDAAGYARPRQRGPLGAAAEQVIAAACPGAIVAPWADAPAIHPYWGPYHSVRAGHAVDSAVRPRDRLAAL